MDRNLLYLVNPISGTKNKDQLTRVIHTATREKALPYHLMDTRADGNYTYLPQYIQDEKITDVIICGGDGSVSTVASYLLDTNVNIGIIPTGSGNGLALTARIPNSTRKSLDIIFEGKSAWIDGFRINGHFSCMMCGIGNDAEIAHEFALTKVRGLKTYIQLSLKKYLSIKPYSFTIYVNDVQMSVEAFFISISNSNQFGNYITIAPRASLNDGLLDIVVVNKMNKLILPFALFHQITGINKLSNLKDATSKRGVFYFQSGELNILNKNLAPIHIDGEPHQGTELINLKIMPNAFRLLQPFR